MKYTNTLVGTPLVAKVAEQEADGLLVLRRGRGGEALGPTADAAGEDAGAEGDGAGQGRQGRQGEGRRQRQQEHHAARVEAAHGQEQQGRQRGGRVGLLLLAEQEDTPGSSEGAPQWAQNWFHI